MAINALAHTVIAHEIINDTIKLLRIADRRVYPLDTLRHVLGALDMLETAERKLVAGARQDGLTWDEIGAVFGTTRQAVSQRFGGGSEVDSERAS